MKIDAYKKYDFKYNEKVFMENLKNILRWRSDFEFCLTKKLDSGNGNIRCVG